MYSIQGIRTVSNSLPKGLKKILKKGGHNYNTIIENWSNLVGKKISDACYPKSVKTNKELMDIFEYDMTDVEDRYLNNRDHVKNKKGADKAGPGLRSQKELFCTLNFAVWKKVYGMTI